MATHDSFGAMPSPNAMPSLALRLCQAIATQAVFVLLAFLVFYACGTDVALLTAAAPIAVGTALMAALVFRGLALLIMGISHMVLVCFSRADG